MFAVVTFTGLVLSLNFINILFLLNSFSNGTFPNMIFSVDVLVIVKNLIRNISEPLMYTNGSDVQFMLFTRTSKPYKLKVGDVENFKQSAFNSSNPTKIIIHGFLSSINEDVFVVNKNAYLAIGDFNVIGMDWSTLCEFEYLSALRGVQTAGNRLAELLNWFLTLEIVLDNFHLIGHSLGAHAAGIAGHIVARKVGRITGLDPANPGFRDLPRNLKLDASDAKLVDVIHTFAQVLGVAQPLGHVDFYPNGGKRQPGCPDVHDIWNVAESIVCNHARSYYYFAETIRNKRAFKSKKCGSIEDALNRRCREDTNVFMGQADTYSKFGLYYIQTKNKEPYTMN